MSLMQKCSLFPMVGLKSKIFAFIAENFTVEVLLLNLWTTMYNSSDLTGDGLNENQLMLNSTTTGTFSRENMRVAPP